ncbi:protein of unknown function [Candidatus Promineifilum breve]|uniref:Uncharacterized protein n=1 Tax=Candidatus Promineifilum breve TaxID=1806508 RepID=A0A160T3M5_9CHLR|nr:protein of unknown function [Candidatus Promineifilum breve]
MRQGRVVTPGPKCCRMACSEYAPCSPWNATTVLSPDIEDLFPLRLGAFAFFFLLPKSVAAYLTKITPKTYQMQLDQMTVSVYYYSQRAPFDYSILPGCAGLSRTQDSDPLPRRSRPGDARRPAVIRIDQTHSEGEIQ